MASKSATCLTRTSNRLLKNSPVASRPLFAESRRSEFLNDSPESFPDSGLAISENRLASARSEVFQQPAKALSEYGSAAEAEEAAEYVSKTYRRPMVSYRCERCALWHLAPAGRQTPSTPCTSCQGRDGQPKATYGSEADAARRARILRKEQGHSLRVYSCPSGRGWHLTKESGR
jgi:hypothetical protein